MREITGWHVLGVMGIGFGIIIAVNMALAVNALRSFPGLEVQNSYVASQSFERERAAQDALGWSVRARLAGDRLVLSITRDGQPVAPVIDSATFGRATSVAMDQQPEFAFDGQDHVATVSAGPGNWNLRLVARAADGTAFRQRIIVEPGQ